MKVHINGRINGTKNEKIRLKSGGHGQDGMNELKKYGIEYNITKTYNNGVRVGNVPNHDDPKKRVGENQAWFPKNWSEKDIKKAGDHVASLKSSRHVADGVAVFGMWKGVRVGVIHTSGQIGTIFPDTYQPDNKRRKKK